MDTAYGNIQCVIGDPGGGNYYEVSCDDKVDAHCDPPERPHDF